MKDENLDWSDIKLSTCPVCKQGLGAIGGPQYPPRCKKCGRHVAVTSEEYDWGIDQAKGEPGDVNVWVSGMFMIDGHGSGPRFERTFTTQEFGKLLFQAMRAARRE